MNYLDYLNYFKTKSKIIYNISDYNLEFIISLITSLSEIKKNSYIEVKNLKNYKEYNNKIGKVIEKLDNNKFKILINKKYLCIKKENLIRYPIILYLLSNEIKNKKDFQWYNISFNFPILNNKDFIIIFYKGDYYFENIERLKIEQLNNFFENASYEITKECNICNEEKINLVCCKRCINTFCKECLNRFEKKECPYCKINIEYDIISI